MVDKVAIGFSADTSKARREMKALAGSFGSLGKVATSAEGKFVAAGLAIAAIGVAIIGTGKALIENAQAVAKNGDEFARMSRVLGTTNKEVQQLSFLAAGARVDFKKLGSGLKRLQRNMLDSTTGNTRMAETFEDLDIKVKKSDGSLRNVMDVSRDLADEIKKMGKGANATGTLMLLLGRAGTETADVFLQGSQAFDNADKSLRRLGAYMSDEAIEASERYTTASVELGVAFQGIKNRLAENLIPALTSLIEYMTETGIPATSNFVESIASLPDFFGDLGTAALRAIPGLDGVADALERINKREALVRSQREQRRKTIASRKMGGGIPADIDISETLASLPVHLGGTGGGGADKATGKRKGKGSASSPVSPNGFASFVDSAQGSFAEMQGVYFDPWIAALEQQDEAERVLAEKRAQRADEQSARMQQQIAEARATADAQMQLAGDVFGAISDFASLAQNAVEDSYFGQTRAGKTAAKIMFVVGKAAALAGAVVNTALAITNALTVQPFPVGAALAVGAGIAGAVQIGTIAATTIQGLADGGLAPGDLRRAGLNNHTVIGVRNDEMVVDPKGTSEISAMFALMRREKEMGMMERGANAQPSAVVVNLDGRRVSDGLAPHQTAMIENGRDPRQNVRYAGAL